MARDLLQGASWECCATAPGAAGSPADVGKLPLEWWPAIVPGTAAAALAAGGVRPVATMDIDGSDWWFRCRVPAGGDGSWTLELDGLATVADVWFRGEKVLHSENMFTAHAVALGPVDAADDIVVRFAALTPLLGGRRPRPRFKTMMADHQGLRWFRTTLLGRQPGWTVTPAPVGPWRPVRLRPTTEVRVSARRVVATWTGDATDATDATDVTDATGGTGATGGGVGQDAGTGTVALMLRLTGVTAPPPTASVRVAPVSGAAAGSPAGGDSAEGPLTVRAEGADVVVEGELRVDGVERWWPHTHGPQPRYAVTVTLGPRTVDVGRVGFRTVDVDRSDGAFTVVVNGVPVFCRGACWWPPDPVNLAISDAELRASVELVRDAHMNMVRIPGGTVYEDDRFWDLCDELGVMVWQDCMLGYVDPPTDDDFAATVVAELDEVLGRLGGRPSLAVLCGGQEIEEQAAMFGLPRPRWGCALIERTIPDVVGRLLPGVPYVTSSPTGGDLPFQPDAGDCHYWGVGSYLRPLEDARSCGIRFMSEGLAFATPPERATVDEECGGAVRAGHHPAWKQALHHDTGRSWDLEDVRDFYVHQLLGVDPHMLRYLDPERALDLGRGVVAELLGRVLAEWRRPGSPCDGGLVVGLRDLAPGAGWGVVDALGRPKSPWFSLRRALAPVAVLVTDEGLNGLHLHVVNDTAAPFTGRLRVELYRDGERRIEDVDAAVDVPARGSVVREAGSLFDGFRDLSYSYRFGPPAYDVVVVGLYGAGGDVVSEVVHFPAGLDRPVEPDVGLQASARPSAGGTWTVSVTTRRLAQWVVVEVPGLRASDSWFHLAPDRTRTLTLHPSAGTAAPGAADPAAAATAPGDAAAPTATDPGGADPADDAGTPSGPGGLVRAVNARTTARLVVGG
jgi:beta-mannosidase